MLVVLTLAQLLVAEPPASDRLVRARICMEEVDLECADVEIEAALASEASLSLEERRAAWRLRAELHLARGRESDAVRAFQALLRIQPGFQPDLKAYPPAWRLALERARDTMEDVFPPALSHTPPRTAAPEEPLVLTAEVRDAGGMGTVVAAVTGGPDVALTSMDGVHWNGVVPATAVREPSVRYSLVAMDRAGNGPVRSGPHEVPVLDARPITHKAWFWVTIGVGTAGLAALVTVLALTADTSEAAAPPRGGVQVLLDIQGVRP